MVKKIKDKNAPKRPLSGFLLYGADIRASDSHIKSLPIKEQAGAIAKKWGELDEIAKAKYTAKSADLKADYISAREAYEKTDEYKQFIEESKGKKGEKTKKRAGPTKVSAYRVFVSETKDAPEDENDPELNGKGHMAKCGIKWAKLSPEQKKLFQDKADQMNGAQNADLLADSQEQESD